MLPVKAAAAGAADTPPQETRRRKSILCFLLAANDYVGIEDIHILNPSTTFTFKKADFLTLKSKFIQFKDEPEMFVLF